MIMGTPLGADYAVAYTGVTVNEGGDPMQDLELSQPLPTAVVHDRT